ncbi:DoxX family protein [Sphingorhabdus sp.]|uniref:DoxX family protein n=1 Tax=Sphingorhabdus sp. TaxID=1902408 RepID=UPI0032B7495E
MNNINEHTNGAAWQPWIATSGRVLLAAIFVLSGIAKLADPTGSAGYIASVGLPAPQLALWGAIAVELLGGLALIAGYKVRLVSAALAAFSVVTAALFHAQLGDQMQFIMFFKNVAMAGGLMQIVAFGGGRLSLDSRFATTAD